MIDDRVRESIEILREHEPEDGYFGCFSGGKDSVLLRHLAERAGVKVRWHYSNTTMDPPELIWFMRKHHPDLTVLQPRHGHMVHRVASRHCLPTRRFRWCCSEYKEANGPRGATLLVGIRAEESARRAKQWDVKTWHKNRRRWFAAPILNWASDELWEYLRQERVPYCDLYDEGWKRLGCIGCPMAHQSVRREEFQRWPRHKGLWRLGCQRLWEHRKGTLMPSGREWFVSATFSAWEEYFEWWQLDRQWPCKRQLQLPGFERRY